MAPHTFEGLHDRIKWNGLAVSELETRALLQGFVVFLWLDLGMLLRRKKLDKCSLFLVWHDVKANSDGHSSGQFTLLYFGSDCVRCWSLPFL